MGYVRALSRVYVYVCVGTRAGRTVPIRRRAQRIREPRLSERYDVHYTGAPRVSCSRRSAYGYRSPLRELIGFGVELLIRRRAYTYRRHRVTYTRARGREDSPWILPGKSSCSMITYYTALLAEAGWRQKNVPKSLL